MKITGTYTIDAPQDQVWEALNDIDVLARIVPGCERLEQTGDNEFEGTVKIGIQAIKGTYSGRIRLEDIQAPNHYKLVASGRSANGVVDGSGTVDLSEQDGKTVLKYGGDAQIGGVLASVGQRLIEGASKQMINQSLKALVEQVKLRADGPKAEDTATEEPAAETSAPPSQEPAAVSEAEPAAESSTASAPAEPAATATPLTAAQPTASVAPAFERRTVVVPADEQLRPESMIRGIVEDMLQDKPWLPWVVVAFLLGLLLGRAGRD